MTSRFDNERLGEALIEYFNTGATPAEIVPIIRESWEISQYERSKIGEAQLKDFNPGR